MMSAALILNRDFALPADGWFHIAPMGEFPHRAAGIVQVVDEAACQAMVAAFAAESGAVPVDEAKAGRFAGLLVDFDHFSLDREKRSEAAGWIVALEARGQTADHRPQTTDLGGLTTENTEKELEKARGGAGLWAQIRWSDLGQAAVAGGRYRFISPVWARDDCEELGPDPVTGQDRLRPLRLLNAAVTNDPNLKGIVPLSNRAEERDGDSPAEAQRRGGETDQQGDGVVANAAGDEVRLKWVLGEPEGGNCPSCAALAGQVHTQAEWDEAGVSPGNGVYCGSDCHCSLVETDEPSSGSLDDVPVSAGGDVENAGHGSDGVMANVWTDAARDAAAAVRQAKAEARRKRKAEADRDEDQLVDAEAGDGAEGPETPESAADAVEKDKSARRDGDAVDRDGAEDLSAEAREAIRAAVRKRMMAAGR